MAGAEDFAALAGRLKAAGEGGLQKELFGAIDDAVVPLQRTLADPFHLYPYMPDRYANVLAADLKVSAVKRATPSQYGVSVRVAGARRDRQVKNLEAGYIRHPVFGRMSQPWKTQFGGMKEGFFSSAVRDATPGIQSAVEDAVSRVSDEIAHG